MGPIDGRIKEDVRKYENRWGKGTKQVAHLMQVQYKYEIRFINNYSTVQLT
jgi:hypothetical protein